MTGQPVLILGVNGSIGSYVARALLARGWPVRALVRDRAQAEARWRDARIEWIEGDAMDRDTVIHAAGGVGTMVHALSPAGYRDWHRLVIPMIDNSIAAARVSGARIVLPGTLYNYDPERTPVITEATPQTPRTGKGRIRAALETRLAEAADECPVLILRAGDFFGGAARSSWFSQALVQPGRPVTRLLNPGKGVGHSWAYLPDLAEAFAMLLERPERLRRFEQVQFAGYWDPDGTLVPRVIRDVVGREVPERAFPWWLMRLLAPFGGFPQAVRDVEPYWRHPMRLDNGRLLDLLGTEPHTPIEVAIRATLEGLGCLPPGPDSHAITGQVIRANDGALWSTHSP